MLFGKIEALQVLQVTKYPFSTTQDQYGTACFVVSPQGIISGTNFVLTQSTLQASHTNTNVTIRCQKSLLVTNWPLSLRVGQTVKAGNGVIR